MTVTPSTMLPLKTVAPDFSLPDTISGKTMTLSELASKQGTVVIFMCNHFPFVHHILDKLIEVGHLYRPQGIRFIAISSNDAKAQPDDGPARMGTLGKHLNFPFPYLYDETQEIAQAYNAACTPDLYVFDGELKCVYRGQFDESRPGNDIPVTGKDLTFSLEKLLLKEPISQDQKPSTGCNIKWKKF